MLKNKRTVSACSLSGCRIRAEALARAFNSRIWPCVWISQRSSIEQNDGMSNGVDDEEEFFDASPSPVELGDESLFCQQHSSAATEEGRAKLYELLQQHATDDAIDVFYDVGEDSSSAGGAGSTCLNQCEQESSRDSDESAQCSGSVEIRSYTSNDLNCDNSSFTENNQSIDNPDEIQNSDIQTSKTTGCENQSSDLDSSECNDANTKNVLEVDFRNELETKEENVLTTEDVTINETEAECPLPCNANNLLNGEEIPKESEDSIASTENAKSIDLPSSDFSGTETTENHEEIFSSVEKNKEVPETVLEDETAKTFEKDENSAQVAIEIDSPSSSSDGSDSKIISPVDRMKVFEESRPKILRSTSLKTGKPPPGTPSRKKIVRFADVLGLDLEDVRHIMSADPPTIPSSAYVDLNLKDVHLPTCEPISEKVEVNRRVSSSWQTVQGTTATNILYPLFRVPAEEPDFMDRVRFQGVCLETVLVSEMNVQCTCRVMNYGYHKKVKARYTVNDWLSSNDIDASYVLGSSNGETDNFAFSIFLSPSNTSVKFALKYEVNGKEYWDNNRNENYCFGFHGIENVNHLPISAWQDQFW